MSSYLVKLIEIKTHEYSGTASFKYLPDPDLVAEGTMYHVYDGDFPYYVVKDGKWIGQKTCKTWWRPIDIIGEIPYAPTPEIITYGTTDEELEKFKRGELDPKEYRMTSNGNLTRKIVKPRRGYKQIGGKWFKAPDTISCSHIMRDEYISCRSISIADCPFSDRGLPADIAPETKSKIYEEDGRMYGYDFTWATAAEISAFYNAEETRIMGAIKDAFARENNNAINKKLDFIIDNMKDPSMMDKSVLDKKEQTEDGEYDDIDSDCSYYDSPQCVIDEQLPNLQALGYELGQAWLLNELYGAEYSEIRFIYYIE